MTSYKGLTLEKGKGKYRLQVQVGGKTRFLGFFTTQKVEEGAQLFDCVQLLLYGPNADTNFPWRDYSRADIEAAAQMLQGKGVDVQQAVVDAAGVRCKGGRLLGVGESHGSSTFVAHVHYREASGKQLNILWGRGLRSVEAAAYQADLGLLAIQGLGGRRTNNTASTYTQGELEEAGKHAVASEVPKELVATNLEEVEQVRNNLHNRHVISCTGVASSRGQEVSPI
jgi:hypothetical protein